MRADPPSMDKILAKMAEHQALQDEHNGGIRGSEDHSAFRPNLDHGSSSNSLPMTPATETFHTTAPTTRPASVNFPESQEGDEVLQLRLQLAQAQTQISKLAEMAQTREGPPEASKQTLHNVSNVSSFARENTWNPPDDTNSETSDPGPGASFARSRGIWGGFRNHSAVSLAAPTRTFGHEAQNVDWARPPTSPFPPGPSFPEQQDRYQQTGTYRGGRLTPDSEFLMRRPGLRGNGKFDDRVRGASGFTPGYAGAFSTSSAAYDPLASTQMSSAHMTPASGYTPMNLNLYTGGPPPMGTSLSPHASEFTSTTNWKGDVGHSASIEL